LVTNLMYICCLMSKAKILLLVLKLSPPLGILYVNHNPNLKSLIAVHIETNCQIGF
jgi:hypothetical protein